MERPSRYNSGGIIALLHLLHKYEPAIRADLLTVGLNIRDVGTPRLTWADLHAFVSSRPGESALRWARIASGEEGAVGELWAITDHLIATQIDVINRLRWELGGAKGTPPELVKRPGVDEPTGETTIGRAEGMSFDEAIRFRDARRAGKAYM